MKASECSSAKYLYGMSKNIDVIKLEDEGGNFKYLKEITVAEAISLAEELMECISWITNNEYEWERVDGENE